MAVKLNATKIDVLITGTQITTPIASQVLTFKAPDAIHPDSSSTPTFYYMTLQESGIKEELKFEQYASTNLITVYNYLLPKAANTKFTRQYRFKKTPSDGFDVEFIRGSESPVPYITIRYYQFKNGARVSGAINTIIGRTFAYDRPTNNWQYVSYINQTNSEPYNVPCFIYDPDNESKAYVGAYLSDLDISGNPQGVRAELKKYFDRSLLETSSESAFPYPSEDTPSGDGAQDYTSEDTPDPDNVWTDYLRYYLCGSNGFATLYYMTTTQMGNFSAELWDSNIVTRLKQQFNNVMDGIVSLMVLPFSVAYTTTQRHIMLGGYEMDAKGYPVTNIAQWIDCGTIELPENWGSFLDYRCHNLSIYLPFVGFRSIDSQYLVGGSLNVKYRVDLLTGSFLCILRYNKNGNSQILDRYNGNMAMQVPVSSQQHTGALQMLTSVAGTVASLGGGNLVGATMSAGSALAAGIQKDVKTVGSFSGNVGFLDSRTPYIVIERGDPQTPEDYQKYYGIPSYQTVKMNTLKGYTKVSEIHLAGIPDARPEEIEELDRLLKKGVVL